MVNTSTTAKLSANALGNKLQQHARTRVFLDCFYGDVKFTPNSTRRFTALETLQRVVTSQCGWQFDCCSYWLEQRE